MRCGAVSSSQNQAQFTRPLLVHGHEEQSLWVNPHLAGRLGGGEFKQTSDSFDFCI